MRLLPRDERFFRDFVAMAEAIRRGTVLLEEMVAPDRPVWDKADEIKEVEHQCDFLAHGLMRRLNRMFVTPFDREDIHALTRSLDDVLDAVDAAAAIIRLYKIERIRPGTRELVRIIGASAEQILLAMRNLERLQNLSAPALELKRLEDEADGVHQTAIRQLFEEVSDAIEILKWKEILHFLELATDRSADVADTLQTVMVKHS